MWENTGLDGERETVDTGPRLSSTGLVNVVGRRETRRRRRDRVRADSQARDGKTRVSHVFEQT